VVTVAAGQLGLAAGGLGTSALAQYGPEPTRLVWWLLLGVSLAAAVAVPAMPETVSGRPGVLAALRPRVAVPRQAQATFATALPCLIAAWMLSGLCLSLGPSLAAQVAGSRDLLWGGLVIFLVADAPARTLVMVPPGVPHSFANPADQPAVILNTFTPDLYIGYFRELRDQIAAGRPLSPELTSETMRHYATY
jgi:hypothetical protein